MSPHEWAKGLWQVENWVTWLQAAMSGLWKLTEGRQPAERSLFLKTALVWGHECRESAACLPRAGATLLPSPLDQRKVWPSQPGALWKLAAGLPGGTVSLEVGSANSDWKHAGEPAPAAKGGHLSGVSSEASSSATGILESRAHRGQEETSPQAVCLGKETQTSLDSESKET